MKNILLILLLIASFNIFGIGGTERVLKFEQMTTDLSNRDLKITPSGSGKVLLGGYSGVLLPVGTTAQRPGTPSVGEMRFNSTLAKFEGYASGAWSNIGGASGGAIGFINDDSSTFEAGTVGGWVTYNDGAGAIPIDGIGGTVASVSTSTSTSLPSRGNYKMLVSLQINSLSGEGSSLDFNIENQDLGKEIIIKLDYVFDSVSGGNSEYTAFIYDITNGAIVTSVGGGFLKTSTNAWTQKTISFISVATSSSYRLIIHHTILNNTGAISLGIDNVRAIPREISPLLSLLAKAPNGQTIESDNTAPSGIKWVAAGNSNDRCQMKYFTGLTANGATLTLVSFTGIPNNGLFSVTAGIDTVYNDSISQITIEINDGAANIYSTCKTGGDVFVKPGDMVTCFGNHFTTFASGNINMDITANNQTQVNGTGAATATWVRLCELRSTTDVNLW